MSGGGREEGGSVDIVSYNTLLAGEGCWIGSMWPKFASQTKV